MNEHREHEYAALRAEVATLRQQVQALLAVQPTRVHVSARWRVSKSMRFMVLPMLMILVAGGVLYGNDAFNALFIDKDGKVGIGTSAPNATLDVAGTLNITQKATLADTQVKGELTTEKTVAIGTTSVGAKLDVGGKGNTEQEIAVQLRSGNSSTDYKSNQLTLGWAGSDTYRHAIKTRHHSGQQKGNAIDFYVWKYDKDKVDAKAIGGLQTMTLDGGRVGIGTTDPSATLDVNGDVLIKGTARSKGRYQRDDEAETTYDLSPRYHLSLTAPKYAMKTKTIPQEVITDLCGDGDGCEVRLAMTRWSSDTQTEGASRTLLLYYFPTDGHWRTSVDGIGIDSNKGVEHVLDIWSTCYFTDGIYHSASSADDNEKGMQLLVWNGVNSSNPYGFTNANRTCELTLID